MDVSSLNLKIGPGGTPIKGIYAGIYTLNWNGTIYSSTTLNSGNTPPNWTFSASSVPAQNGGNNLGRCYIEITTPSGDATNYIVFGTTQSTNAGGGFMIHGFEPTSSTNLRWYINRIDDKAAYAASFGVSIIAFNK